MDVSIIIVNYNTRDLTNNCINSILEKTIGISYEIILVDNASTDGSKELFQSRNEFTYIYNDKNLGFGLANNLGYKNAKGDYIFILNSDTFLINNAVKEFFNFAITSDANIACVGSVLYNKELEAITSETEFLTFKRVLKSSIKRLNPYAEKALKNKKLYHNTTFPVNVEAIIGADIFIKRSVIEQLGLFDDRIFMYCEEIDLQKRYLDAGFISVLIDTPKIIHLEGQSTKNYTAKRNILFTKGVFYYLKKYNSKNKYLFFRVVYLFIKLPIILNFKYSFKDRISIICFLISQK